jgi:outer membrane protein W
MDSGNGTTYAIGLLAGPDYNFNIKDSKFVPYVGVYGGIYFAQRDNDNGGTSSFTEGALDGHVGCRYFVGEHTTINLQVSYQYIFVSEAGGQDIGNIIASLGISYFF